MNRWNEYECVYNVQFNVHYITLPQGNEVSKAINSVTGSCSTLGSWTFDWGEEASCESGK